MGGKETEKSNIVMMYEKRFCANKHIEICCSGQYNSNTKHTVRKIPINFLLLHETTELFVVGYSLV